jgi:S1-C subfamily serine protease
LGITVTDDARGGVGVRVSKVVHGDVAHSAGLCVGDVITHVNGIHVTSHSDAIRIFNCAKAHGVPMRLCVHVGKSGWWSSWWNACLPKDETRVVRAIVPYV